MKKIFLILFTSLFLSAVFIVGFHYFLQFQALKGALQVTSSPESKVYLNNKYIGQTPLCKCESSDMVATGDYTIRLVPSDSSLQEFQEKVTLSEGVLTVVDRRFAKDSLSEGSIISLSPLTDKKKTELLVVSLPEGSHVLLDNNDIGQTPVSFKNPTESDHVLKVSKDGYKEKAIRIRTPLGYKLTVAAYLSTLDDLSASSASSSAKSALSPTPSITGKSVLILDTPTGFLRVRESVGGLEIGQVNPGESFPLIDEQSGWFEIRLQDGRSGWVSTQYTKKQ
ncbi:MAG TPA: PEGA domain-containing protein [Methylomirabilota bacterium]|nr:PEGA domain-containing protein [Methylomirabilota bacterium]